MAVMTALIMGFFLIPAALAAGFANPQFLVESDWLAGHFKDPELRVLDVRKISDYQLGHIPNAIHINLQEAETAGNGVKGMLAPVDQIKSLLGQKGITSRSKVVIYDDTLGPFASRTFWILDYLGHKNMALLNGGWTKWKSENREISQQLPVLNPASYEGSPDPQKLASADWILRNMKNPEIAILDVRSHNEFTGEDTRAARGGHIPGAVHLEWKKSLSEQGVIKPVEELSEMMNTAGINKGKEVVIYCQTGKRAAQSYFILRLLGYEHVRLYDGSWEEWGNDNRYPVETGPGENVSMSPSTC